jgi:dTDP-4-dehydrorhamnose reductase
MSSAQSVPPTLFTGVGGVLGRGFSQHRLPLNSHYFSRNKYPQFPAEYHVLDLLTAGAAQALIESLRPQLVVHAASLSSAQQCADEPEQCQRVNVESVAEIAAATRHSNAQLIYISTEQVFDGSAEVYTEKCTPNAITAYGRSKAAAESIVLENGGTVVRLPLLLGSNYNADGGGADSSLLQALKNHSELSMFVDEWRAPVAADVIWPMIKILGERKIGGVFHLAGADVVSRFELAQSVCKVANVKPTFQQSSIADFDGPRRSPRLALSSKRAQQLLNYRPPSLLATLMRLHSNK